MAMHLSGSLNLTGSLNVSSQIQSIGLTGSLLATNGVISSSQQIRNYNIFAETASANIFYGNQTVSGSLYVSGGIYFSGSLNISGAITNTKYIDFELADFTSAVGRVGWDTGEGTLTMGVAGGTLDVPVGVIQFETIFNADTSSISKGEAVRIIGAQGNRIAVKKAHALDDDGSAEILGLAAETIGVGIEGKVIKNGPLKGVDTSGYTAGQKVYLSTTAGQITVEKPQAPIHLVWIGTIQKINAASGIIHIHIQNGYEIDELHDVRVTTASLADKQLLARSGSVWANKTINELGIAITGSNTFMDTQSVSGALYVTSNSGFGSSDATGSGILKVISAGTQTAFAIGQSNSKRFTGFGANDLKVYGDDYFITTMEAFPLSLGTNYTARLTLANDGGISANGAITASNFRIGSSGGGVDFSVTTNGSGTTTSELLNDYEEGTWTPTLTPGTSGTITIDGTSTKASYTKIGRTVTLQVYIVVSSVSSPVGRLRVGGFPFTIGSNLGDPTGVVYNNGFTGNPGGWPILRAAAGNTYAYVDVQEGDGTDPAIDLSDHITTNTELTFSFTYFV